MKEDQLLTDIIAELDADPFYNSPDKGNFTPTLVVGLGGTGTRVLRHLKKYLGSERAGRVRLFGIDSDKAENDSLLLPPLNESELCLLDPKRAISWLDRYDAGEADYKWLSAILEETGPENSIEAEIRQKVQAGVGCGQRRRAGRLMFCANVNGGANVRRRFNELYRELRSLRSELRRIHSGVTVDEGTRVFVVTSFAGGTGAGIVVDTLALLRTIFEGETDDITLIGLLPGQALDMKLTDTRKEKGFTRGNAVGLLRELDGLRRPGCKRVFRFGAHDTIEWKSTQKHIATNVYLVGNECGLRGGAPVTDWDDLITATGFFLYNFFENGVGASAFSGEVNYAPDTNFEGKNGAVYRSFGISAVRYPVEDLIRLGLFLKAGEFFDQAVKKPKDCLKAGEKAAGLTLSSLGISSADDFLSPFDEISIDESYFMVSDAQWKKIKWASDDELTGAGQNAIRSMKDGLSSYDSAFDERVEETLADLTAKLEGRALEALTGNHELERAHFAKLLSRLDEMGQEIYDQLDAYVADLESTEQEIARRERRIHRLDFFLDFKDRAVFRTLVQGYLRTIEEKYRLEKARNFLIAVLQAIRAIQTKVLGLFDELKGKRLLYRTQAEAYSKLLEQGLFVQSGMDTAAVTEWLDELDADISAVPAKSLNLDGVLRPLFLPLIKAMRDSLKHRDIVADAFKKASTKKKKGDDRILLKDRLTAAKEASQPLIALTSTAPQEEDLTPQRYALAVSAEEHKEKLSKVFPGLGDNQTKMIPLASDGGTVAFLSTVVGYRISDLKRFEEFHAYYAQHPWIFHTDENYGDLPALDPKMAAENHKYKIFGLGLFLEALESKGSNYYNNLVRRERVGHPEFQYIVYSKERNANAQALKDHNLVAEAPKSQTRQRAEDRIDNSLEGALDCLASPEYVAISELIDDVWESFVNRVGKADAKTRLERFAEETVDGMIARTKAQSERKEALKRVYQALLEVADAIE